MAVDFKKVYGKYHQTMNTIKEKSTALSDEYLNMNLESLTTWEGNIEDLKNCSEEFKMTKKLVSHLKRDVIINYLGYLIRKLLALLVIVGIPALIVKRFPLLLMSAIIVGMVAYTIVINDKILMKPNLGDLKMYNMECRCFIIPIDTKYNASAEERGIIVNDLFINLNHDANYNDFDNKDAVMLIVAPNGEYRVHKI